MSSLPPPNPIAPLEYGQPSERGRPGLLTAVGIISIVIGSLGTLWSLLSVLAAISLMALSRMPMTLPAPPIPTNSSGTVTVNGIPIDPEGSPDGMDDSQRHKVISAIALAQPVSSFHRQHLDLLLKNSGAKIFPFVNQYTSVDEIRAKITTSTSETIGGLSYVDTPTGVIQISNTQATFQPSHGGETVRAIAGPTSPSVTPPVRRTSVVAFTKVSMTASIISLVESLISLAITILLLIGGINVLRNSPSYLRLHWIYVFVKIPLVCVAVVATWLTYNSMGNISTNMPHGSVPPVRMDLLMLVPAIIWALIVVSYPIALLFVLRSRSAKAFNADLSGIRDQSIPFAAIN